MVTNFLVLVQMTKEVFLHKMGANIERIRKEAGLTQVELSLRIGRTKQNINRIEKGGHNTSAFILFEIAKALKVSVNELLEF